MKLNHLLDITRDTGYSSLVPQIEIWNTFIFRRATWKTRAPVLSVWTLSKIEMTSMTKFNTCLRMSHFFKKVSRYLFNYKISFRVEKYIFVKKGPDGPKGAPRWKDRGECFTPLPTLRIILRSSIACNLKFRDWSQQVQSTSSCQNGNAQWPVNLVTGQPTRRVGSS